MGAGIIVSRITGTSALFWKSTLKWKVPLRWYIASLGIPLLVLLILSGIYHAWGIPSETVGLVDVADAVPWYMFPPVLLFMIIIGGGMEEPGWRGYAQSRMLALYTPFVASLILGVIWTYWHAPLFFVPGSSQQGIQLGWYTAGVTGLAIILTWIFIRSEGSAWLAIIFHGSANAINVWVPSFNIYVAGLEFTDFAVMEFTYVMVAVLILLFNREIFFKKIRPSNDLVVHHPSN